MAWDTMGYMNFPPLHLPGLSMKTLLFKRALPEKLRVFRGAVEMKIIKMSWRHEISRRALICSLKLDFRNRRAIFRSYSHSSFIKRPDYSQTGAVKGGSIGKTIHIGFAQSKNSKSKSSFSASKLQFSLYLSESKHSNPIITIWKFRMIWPKIVPSRNITWTHFQWQVSPFVSEGSKPEQLNWPITNRDWRKQGDAKADQASRDVLTWFPSHGGLILSDNHSHVGAAMWADNVFKILQAS